MQLIEPTFLGILSMISATNTLKERIRTSTSLETVQVFPNVFSWSHVSLQPRTRERSSWIYEQLEPTTPATQSYALLLNNILVFSLSAFARHRFN